MNKEEALRKIAEEIASCRKCDLWKTRNKPVPGEGNANATVMLVGLGPGRQEDAQGRPFVGAAGKFLDELLAIAGIKRSEVFITNVMKCYLPNNVATEEQIKACTPYLERQISVIAPKVIVALGNVAVEFLFSKFGLKNDKISKIHGKVFKVQTLWGTLYLVAMYHPATALYNPALRQVLIDDWRKFGVWVKERLT